MRHRRACRSKFPIDADWLAGPAAVPLTIGLVGTPGTLGGGLRPSQHGRCLPPLPMFDLPKRFENGAGARHGHFKRCAVLVIAVPPPTPPFP